MSVSCVVWERSAAQGDGKQKRKQSQRQIIILLTASPVPPGTFHGIAATATAKNVGLLTLMRTDTSAGRQANSFAGWQVN